MEGSRVVLFDIRIDDSQVGFIGLVNKWLDSEPVHPYLARFGHVCSPQWWAHFDQGDLPVEVLDGDVSFVGLRPEPSFDESVDIVEFNCRGQVVAYDRLNYWAAHPIRVGDRLSVTRTVVDLQTRNGLVRYEIDLRAEWTADSDDQLNDARSSCAH